MNGFRRVTGRRAKLLRIHDGVREQLRSAIVERQHALAGQMIAGELLATLKRNGPRATTLQVRFLHQQADGLDREQSFTARVAFLLRQVRRLERKLDEE